MISDVELAKLFGRAFASEVFTLEPGNWYGPLLSGYGTHLLYVHELREGTLPAFEEISDVVKVDWEKKKLEELNDLYEEGLLSRYEIIIEGKNDNAGFE
jgi:parvulin-like peptidyl-prolyl isomerase